MKNENLFKAIKNTEELINKKLYFYKKKNMYFELVSTTCNSTIDRVSIDYYFVETLKQILSIPEIVKIIILYPI